MIAAAIGLCACALYLALLGLGIRWCGQDARNRGKSPVLVCLVVIFFFPLGLILWLLLRPPVCGPGQSSGSFSLDDYRVQ